MFCAPHSKFGMFGSLFFLGAVISSLIFPRLSDIYGRKKIAMFGQMIHLFAVTALLNTTNFNMGLVTIFTLGMAMGPRAFVGYCWMTEHMRSSDVARATAV